MINFFVTSKLGHTVSVHTPLHIPHTPMQLMFFFIYNLKLAINSISPKTAIQFLYYKLIINNNISYVLY